MSQPSAPSILVFSVGPSFRGGFPDATALATFRDTLVTDRLGALLDYWLAKCEAGMIPRRADFQPTEIKSLLPYLTIWERVAESRTNRIRLMGTRLTEEIAADPSNRLTADFLPDEWTRAMRDTDRPFYDEHRPLYFAFSLAPFGRDHVALELLTLPLRRDGKAAEMGVGIFARLPREESAEFKAAG